MFTGREPLEVLVPLAWLLSGASSRVHVVWIEDVPHQAPFWLFSEPDAQVLARFAQASKGQPSCSFEGVLTHRREQVLYERASDPNIRWVVMCWKPQPLWRRAIDPLSRFLNAPPCHLAVYRPRAQGSTEADNSPLRPNRILVFASGCAQDAFLLRIASRVGTWSDTSEITVAHLAALEATLEDLLEVQSYHESLCSSAETRAGIEIVRSTDPLRTSMESTRNFDLLILGRAPHQGAFGRLRTCFEDRLAAGASCAVIQLRAGAGSSPLDLTHLNAEQGSRHA